MSDTVSAADFWRAMDRYHELAETFDRNIEAVYPDRVTSRSMCHCLDATRWCGYPMDGKAEYYQYTGPSIHNI